MAQPNQSSSAQAEAGLLEVGDDLAGSSGAYGIRFDDPESQQSRAPKALRGEK